MTGNDSFWDGYKRGLEEGAKLADEFRRGAGDPVCGQVAEAIKHKIDYRAECWPESPHHKRPG